MHELIDMYVCNTHLYLVGVTTYLWFLAGLISRVDIWEGGGQWPIFSDLGDGEVIPLCEERWHECPGCSPWVTTRLSASFTPTLFYDGLN
jgi:hypothetical protein